MIDLTEIDSLVFHDMPLTGMSINLESSSTLTVDILVFQEGKDDYSNKTVIFGELVKVNPQTISIEDFSEAEIYSFDYRLRDHLFVGKMTCLLGMAKPSIEIEFSCKTVEILDTEIKFNKP